jgi:hypothetical protein
MTLPVPIADYFRMKNAHDDKGLASLFSDEAVVIDGGENLTIRGAGEIKTWIAKSISGLNLQTDIRDYKTQNGEWVVDTVVAGDFKASPARFQYFITLRGDRISSLRVEFLGSLK